MRRTKIIATLGPSSDSREMIERLIKLGVNVFRLNFSHGSHTTHKILINRIRAIAGRLDLPVAILQDISGPKIRVGNIDGIMRLEAGDRLTIYPEETQGHDLEISITHSEILQTVRKGDPVYFADGTIRAEVCSRASDRIIVSILVGGKLTSHKGVNFPLSDLQIDAITEKDKEDIAFGITEDVDYIALSFVRSAEDIIRVRESITDQKSDIPIIAKIEKSPALEQLDEIMKVADGVMVARGDLGVELGLSVVPVVQKRIIQRANNYGIPVTIATQMLTSMLTSQYPTRAEVSDIANAVLDGADAVMLSDETAVGNYSQEAISVLDSTITETEKIYPWYGILDDAADTREAIAASATSLSRRSEANGIICFSNSGQSALKIARHRPQTRLIATTSNRKTYRRLAMIWGIEPFFVEFSHANSDRAISLFVKQARNAGLIHQNDKYVITIGHHSNLSGTTNQIQLLDKESFQRLQAMLKGLY